MARSQYLKSRNIDNANKKALHGVGDITSPFSKYVVNKNLPTYRCTNNDKRPIIGHLASNLWPMATSVMHPQVFIVKYLPNKIELDQTYILGVCYTLFCSHTCTCFRCQSGISIFNSENGEYPHLHVYPHMTREKKAHVPDLHLLMRTHRHR